MATSKEEFGLQYGIAGNGGVANFSQMLRLCIDLFDHSTYSIYIKEIVFMTDRESPYYANSREFDIALRQAKGQESSGYYYQLYG